MISIEKIVRCWLVFSLAVLVSFAAWLIFGNGWRWLRLDGQSSQAGQSDLMRYQVGGKGQNWPVAILSDLKSLRSEFQHSLLKSAPDDRMASDGFGRGTDDRQRGAIVLKVSDEGDFYFSVLVAQDHGIQSTASAHFRAQTGATGERRFITNTISSIVQRRAGWMKNQ